jgi:quinol monooxygenase YgiN
MVRLSLTLSGPERKANQIRDALRSLAMSTRLEQGCLGCRVWLEDDGDSRSVNYEESWATERDMRRRVRSDRFTSLLSLMEVSEESPDVHFEFVETMRGLDYIAEVRGRPDR